MLGNLIYHINLVHQVVKYVCNQCEYKLSRWSNLKIPIQAVHKGTQYVKLMN